MKKHRMVVALGVVSMGAAVTVAALAADGDPVEQARHTLALFQKTDPGLKRFVDTSSGYVVFPNIGKGAVGIGGAHGSGILFEQGRPTATASLTQVTVGLQLGGQS